MAKEKYLIDCNFNYESAVMGKKIHYSSVTLKFYKINKFFVGIELKNGFKTLFDLKKSEVKNNLDGTITIKSDWYGDIKLRKQSMTVYKARHLA